MTLHKAILTVPQLLRSLVDKPRKRPLSERLLVRSGAWLLAAAIVYLAANAVGTNPDLSAGGGVLGILAYFLTWATIIIAVISGPLFAFALIARAARLIRTHE